MTDFKPACKIGDVTQGKSKVVTIDGHFIALFNVNGSLYALDNTCLHRGGPLGEGQLEGNVITCPWHGWQYDVKSGRSLVNPLAKVKSYPVRVDGDTVLVKI